MESVGVWKPPQSDPQSRPIWRAQKLAKEGIEMKKFWREKAGRWVGAGESKFLEFRSIDFYESGVI